MTLTLQELIDAPSHIHWAQLVTSCHAVCTNCDAWISTPIPPKTKHILEVTPLIEFVEAHWDCEG